MLHTQVLPSLNDILLDVPTPHVLLITFHRPKALNALNLSLHNDLSAALDLFESNDDLWCAILTGDGRAFSAGNDVVEMSQHPEAKKDLCKGFGGLTNRQTLNKPIIAAVNGICMGGGFELALACDIILASVEATFALPEVRVGLTPLAGGTANLWRLIGYHNAMRLMLTGMPVSAQELKALGFVQEVVDDPHLLPRAKAIAQAITANSPDAIRAVKAQTRRARELGWIAAYEEMEKLPEGENLKEGAKAFAEKRAPEWKPLASIPK